MYGSHEYDLGFELESYRVECVFMCFLFTLGPWSLRISSFSASTPFQEKKSMDTLDFPIASNRNHLVIFNPINVCIGFD